MKPVEDPEFRIGGNVRISKYKNIFAIGYVPNLSEEGFVITKVKNTIPWIFVVSDLKGNKNCWNVLRKRIAKNKSKIL